MKAKREAQAQAKKAGLSQDEAAPDESAAADILAADEDEDVIF